MSNDVGEDNSDFDDMDDMDDDANENEQRHSKNRKQVKAQNRIPFGKQCKECLFGNQNKTSPSYTNRSD